MGIRTYILILLLWPIPFLAQGQSARLQGKVTDPDGQAIESAAIGVRETGRGTRSLRDGSFDLEVPAEKPVHIIVQLLGYQTLERKLHLKEGETLTLDFRMEPDARTLDEVIKKADRRQEAGNISIEVDKANLLPTTGFGSGIESMIKTFVGSHNELSSQYSVRGGNFDENLVYVNDFEIYRPFLIRSGQQEGMSFIHSDLVSGVNFSVGGFQSKFGDKMSSVLDVQYKTPESFGGRAVISALGGSLALEGASQNKKLTYLFGLRQKSNQYLLQAQPTKGVYNPSFTDGQMLVKYRFNPKWESEIILNYARNRFQFLPQTSTSSFGLINQVYQLRVFYQGAEIDQFDSKFAGWSWTYRPGSRWTLKLLISGFQTDERETYDIKGEYLLGEVESDLGKENFGQIKTYLGTGIIHEYARNQLNVLVGNIALRGAYDGGNHFIQWGLDAQQTQIEDRLHEWERRDSAGFTQPYYPDRLELTQSFHSSHQFQYQRYSGFLQDNLSIGDQMRASLGLRWNYSSLNKEWLISPRGQLSYKPGGWERDILFKFAAGLYQQPPFYREMRDLNGIVNPSLRAQKSFHWVGGVDYHFLWDQRPFKLTTEVYYKSLWDLVPYEYDNVRIRYFGQNQARGYAVGGEVRLYGDIVPEATSWISVGIMKSEEDILNDSYTYFDPSSQDSMTIYPGMIPRPTDQRFMLGMYFEDYFPRWKNFKMHLNLLYASGLPFGPPDSQRYGDTLRIPPYRRVDIGFSALLWKGSRHPSKKLSRTLERVWLSAEVFNLLGIQNTLSYTWIMDQSSGRTYAVPNRLTSRLINAKLVIDF